MDMPALWEVHYALKVQMRQGASADAVVAGMFAALQTFDSYTADHSSETSRLAEKVAHRLGVSDRAVEEVALVAVLHDIGKIGIPAHLLHKPGRLTAHEFDIVRRHPVIGEWILGGIPELRAVAVAVRHEHERWDGAGYPDGLVGHAIPLASRIVFACDSWHAMTSDRPYRKALTESEALSELRRCSGTQFDPWVIQALLAVLGEPVAVAASATDLVAVA